MRRLATVLALTAVATVAPLATGASAAERGHYQPGSCGMGWLSVFIVDTYGSVAAGREPGDPPYGTFVQSVRDELAVVEPCKGKG